MHFFVVFKKLQVILQLYGQIFAPRQLLHVLLYYRSSMALCNICIYHIHLYNWIEFNDQLNYFGIAKPRILHAL